MHINITTHMKRIEIDTTVMKIGINLIIIGQIKFTLDVRMIGFMN
jgi:hypothetical protein